MTWKKGGKDVSDAVKKAHLHETIRGIGVWKRTKKEQRDLISKWFKKGKISLEDARDLIFNMALVKKGGRGPKELY